MIANKTYNNVINTLKNIGNQHDQIATVTTGDIFSLNLEKMANNLSNEQEVLSQCLQISIDIISMLRHSEHQSTQNVDDINAPVYFADGQQTLEPFTERFDNLLTGWVFSLSVLVANNFDACIIPAQAGGSGE